MYECSLTCRQVYRLGTCDCLLYWFQKKTVSLLVKERKDVIGTLESLPYLNIFLRSVTHEKCVHFYACMFIDSQQISKWHVACIVHFWQTFILIFKSPTYYVNCIYMRERNFKENEKRLMIYTDEETDFFCVLAFYSLQTHDLNL